uniref:Uncharacterized protein n=1 Tax=viral metagenome TaxID=1070528 RepID=A0A6C0JSC7_9ZZZZ
MSEQRLNNIHAEMAVNKLLHPGPNNYGEYDTSTFKEGIFESGKGVYSWKWMEPGFTHECYIAVGGKNYYPGSSRELDVNGKKVVVYLWEHNEEWDLLPTGVVDEKYTKLIKRIPNAEDVEEIAQLARFLKRYTNSDTLLFDPNSTEDLDLLCEVLEAGKIRRLIWDKPGKLINRLPIVPSVRVLMVKSLDEEVFDYIYASNIEELAVNGGEVKTNMSGVSILPRPGKKLRLKTLICWELDELHKIMHCVEPSEIRNLYVDQLSYDTPFLDVLQANVKTLMVRNTMPPDSDEERITLGFTNLDHLTLGDGFGITSGTEHSYQLKKSIKTMSKGLPNLQSLHIPYLKNLSSGVKGVPKLEIGSVWSSDWNFASGALTKEKFMKYAKNFGEIVIEKASLPFIYSHGNIPRHWNMMNPAEGVTVYDHFFIGNGREYYDEGTAKLTSILTPSTRAKGAHKVVR